MFDTHFGGSRAMPLVHGAQRAVASDDQVVRAHAHAACHRPWMPCHARDLARWNLTIIFTPIFLMLDSIHTRLNNYIGISSYHMNHQVLHCPIFPTKLAHSANPASPSSSNCSATCSSSRNSAEAGSCLVYCLLVIWLWVKTLAAKWYTCFFAGLDGYSMLFLLWL